MKVAFAIDAILPDVEGELEAYGPLLCVGYLDPALNVAFMADGFLRTGDLAVMDEAGYVRITGRRKDIIVRKGENLSAKELRTSSRRTRRSPAWR